MLPLFDLLGVKISVFQGGFAGGLISVVITEGGWIRRILRGAGGALFAVVGTEGALDIAHNWIVTTPATERLGGLVFGMVGIYVAEALMKIAERVRDKSDKIADKLIKKVE